MQRLESPHRADRDRPAPGGRLAGLQWLALALAVPVVACIQTPQAPVAQGLAAEAPVTTPCRDTPTARAALQQVAEALQAQGMALQAQGMALQARCPATGEGWVVQVRVVDGLKASKVVRGPLADGQEVDMGTPAGVELAGAASADPGLSPDVQHNRAWLRTVMARYQFDNAPQAWWRFALRGADLQRTADTDLAAR